MDGKEKKKKKKKKMDGKEITITQYKKTSQNLIDHRVSKILDETEMRN